MTTLLLIAWIVLILGLILVLTVRPRRTHSSRYELERLHDSAALRRERLLGGVFALQRVIVLFLTIAMAQLAVVLFGGWSIVATLIVLVVVLPTARIRFITSIVGRYYDRHESQVLIFVEKTALIGWFMLPGDKARRDHGLESAEQLLHQVETASFLSAAQQAIITRSINWHQTTVESIMTPRKRVASIKRSELLGPLVLNDLHKTGYNQFPVTRVKDGLDEIVGVLDITDLLESVTADRSSQTVEEIMLPKVLRIETDEPLPNALALLQESHLHMLIVTDADGKTVGLVTLADITASLLGKTEVK